MCWIKRSAAATILIACAALISIAHIAAYARTPPAVVVEALSEATVDSFVLIAGSIQCGVSDPAERFFTARINYEFTRPIFGTLIEIRPKAEAEQPPLRQLSVSGSADRKNWTALGDFGRPDLFGLLQGRAVSFPLSEPAEAYRFYRISVVLDQASSDLPFSMLKIKEPLIKTLAARAILLYTGLTAFLLGVLIFSVRRKPPVPAQAARPSSHFLRGLVLVLSALIGSAAVNYQNDFFHIEHNLYIPQMLKPVTLAQRIFDPANEYAAGEPVFRARELSTLVNYWDFEFILFSLKHAFPHFLSASHYVTLLLIAAMLLWVPLSGAQRERLSIPVSLAFLLSPGPFLSGAYYRSSKGLAALFILAYIMLLYRAAHTAPGSYTGRLSGAMAFILFVGASLVDEQGYACMLLLLVFPCVLLFVYHQKGQRKVLLGSGLGLIVVLLYRWLWGPFLYKYFSGLDVSLQYSARVDLSNMLPAFGLLLDYMSTLFGSPGRIVTASMLAIILILVWKSPQTFFPRLSQAPRWKRRLPVLLLAGSILYITFLFNLASGAHHAMLFCKELAVTYYLLPALALTMGACAIMTAQYSTQSPGAGRVLYYFFLCICLLNLQALPMPIGSNSSAPAIRRSK